MDVDPMILRTLRDMATRRISVIFLIRNYRMIRNINPIPIRPILRLSNDVIILILLRIISRRICIRQVYSTRTNIRARYEFSNRSFSENRACM